MRKMVLILAAVLLAPFLPSVSDEIANTAKMIKKYLNDSESVQQVKAQEIILAQQMVITSQPPSL